MNKAAEKLCFALDVRNANEAQKYINLLKNKVGTFKVGPEVFISGGPTLIHRVKASGAKCLLDLKLHDIPETVSRSVERALSCNVDFITVHASGGQAMLKAAVESAEDKTKILAVTALTSLSDDDCHEIFNRMRERISKDLMFLGKDSKVHGFVCSPNELKWKKLYQDSFFLVPGIRPAGSDLGDQRATGTPEWAIKQGADMLVVGRPIRDAQDPVRATDEILNEIQTALDSE